MLLDDDLGGGAAGAESPVPACPGCGGPLDLSQPDPLDPDELVGRCRGCRSTYFLVDDGRRYLVVARVRTRGPWGGRLGDRGRFGA